MNEIFEITGEFEFLKYINYSLFNLHMYVIAHFIGYRILINI